MAAAFADALLNLFVGQHGAQRGAPVDRGVELIGQPMLVAESLDRLFALFGNVVGDRQVGDRPAALRRGVEPGIEQHQEDELRPAEVIDVGGGQFAAPVVGEAEHLQLPAEIGDVLLGRRARMRAGFLGVLFGGQAEGIPAHRVHHGRAAHSLEAADDVGGGVALGMPDVQPLAARIREHVQDVQFAAFGEHGAGESPVLFPELLPFRLDDGGVVAWHGEEAGGQGLGGRDQGSEERPATAVAGDLGPGTNNCRNVAFRSAKERGFRGAKGDLPHAAPRRRHTKTVILTVYAGRGKRRRGTAKSPCGRGTEEIAAEKHRRIERFSPAISSVPFPPDRIIPGRRPTLPNRCGSLRLPSPKGRGDKV